MSGWRMNREGNVATTMCGTATCVELTKGGWIATCEGSPDHDFDTLEDAQRWCKERIGEKAAHWLGAKATVSDTAEFQRWMAKAEKVDHGLKDRFNLLERVLYAPLAIAAVLIVGITGVLAWVVGRDP